jgi:hypothetical protein
MDSGDPRSIVDLISTLTADLANLVRKESELIRAEVSEKLSQSMAAGRLLGIGAALLLGAFLVLLQALVLALSKVMDPLWASLVVGVVIGGTGLLLIRNAAEKVSPGEMMPDRSARQLRKDAQLMKDQIK